MDIVYVFCLQTFLFPSHMTPYKRSPTIIAGITCLDLPSKLSVLHDVLDTKGLHLCAASVYLGCRSSSATCRSGNWQPAVSHPYLFDFSCRQGAADWQVKWEIVKERETRNVGSVKMLCVLQIQKLCFGYINSLLLEAIAFLFIHARQEVVEEFMALVGHRNPKKSLLIQSKDSSSPAFCSQQWPTWEATRGAGCESHYGYIMSPSSGDQHWMETTSFIFCLWAS